jgi:adenylate cyclase
MSELKKQTNYAADILIVDDKIENIRFLADFLGEQNYQIRKAIDGKTALRAANTVLPDLILLDIKMPGLSGYEVCKQLKDRETTRSIPIIFLSAGDDASDKVKAFQVGGVDYITKPFQLEEVLARVEAQLTLQRLQKKLEDRNQALQKTIAHLEQTKNHLEQSQAALKESQARSERLLYNVLPCAIAERLKQDSTAIAEQFNDVSILFADIVGFTPLAVELKPTELVALLNDIFSRFDRLSEQYGLEKIKTIGDAYMVVAGLPFPHANAAVAIAEMALAMQATIATFKRPSGEPLKLRIGINSGSVVAGVIGVKKFVYDLWGNAVNIASYLESSGQPGKIQVTQTLYDQTSNINLPCTLRLRSRVKLKS